MLLKLKLSPHFVGGPVFCLEQQRGVVLPRRPQWSVPRGCAKLGRWGLCSREQSC